MAVPSYSSRTNASAASNGVNTAMSDESTLQQESLDDIDSLPHKNVLKLKSSDSVSVMKKRGSFQITSVVVAKSNHTEDLDSFDDLDETHTEEMSSEIGDTSKITDIDVDPSSTEEITASATTPTEAEDVFQQSKTLPDTDVINKVHSNNDIHSRFKLVKIESKEPFVRGRWTCLDYRNPPTEKSLEKSLEDAGSGNSSTTSSINYVHGIDDPLKDPLLTTLVADGHSIIEPQPIHPGNSQLRNNEFLSANLAATTQSNTLTHSTTQAQSSVSQSVLSTPSAVLNPHSQNTTLAPVPSNTVITEQASDYISSGQEPYISSQGQEYIPQPEYATHHPAVSIGGDIISQSTSQSQIDTHPQAVPSDYSASQQGSTLNGASISDFNKSLEAVTALNSAKLSVPAASIATQGNAANSSSPSNDNPENKDISADYVQNAIPEVGDEIEESGEDDDSVSTGSSSDETDSKSVVAHQITAPPTGHSFLAPPLLEMVATMQPGSQLANKENGDERELLNVFSGASTVAIDNKIEQAMDLVKSHLMFAVREEVEVLKEQIKELIEKNSQLEIEVSILKASATPETLAKLNANTSQPTQASASAAPANSQSSVTQPPSVQQPPVQQQSAATPSTNVQSTSQTTTNT